MTKLGSDQVADKLQEIAFLLTQAGENRFKTIAYKKAADAIRTVANLDSADLQGIPGIGPSIAQSITELLATGSCEKLRSLQQVTPPSSIQEFTAIPKVGPVGARRIWDDYSVATLAELEAAIAKGKVTDQKLIDGLAFVKKQSQRVPLFMVLPYVEKIMKEMAACPYIETIEPAGSLRRHRETIGHDIDLLVGVKEANRTKFIDWIRKSYKVDQGGETRIDIHVEWEGKTWKIDLHITAMEHYWAYLNYLTGSRDFNIRMRQLALSKGMSINQFWVEKGSSKIFLKSEEHLFELLGIPFVPPECRETGDEVGKDFSDLVTWDDLFADYHVHSDWSDGVRLEDVVATARKFAYTALGIADHSHSTFGLKSKDIARYVKAVHDQSTKAFPVYAGVELDTMRDGKLDFEPEELNQFDFVVIAAHRQPGENLVGRYASAIAAAGPLPKIIAHPTCRVLGHRDISETNWDELFKLCQKTGTALEINSQPERIDLPWWLVRKAKGYGLKFAINTDCHGTDFSILQYGLYEARKGMVTKKDLFKL